MIASTVPNHRALAGSSCRSERPRKLQAAMIGVGLVGLDAAQRSKQDEELVTATATSDQ